MINQIHPYFLAAHIAAGTVSLLIVPLIMLFRKGGKTHAVMGNIYFWGMSIVTVTAIAMAIYHNIPFLLIISVFSYVSVIKGVRSIALKRYRQVSGIPAADWIILFAAMIFDLAMLVYGFMMLQESKEIAIISFFFGGTGIAGELMTLQSYMRKPDEVKRNWLRSHISLMLGSYIATVTAFLVNTASFLPDLVRWLGPTVIGVPLISYAVRYYTGSRKKEISNSAGN